jgi:hypothetical protein
VRVRGRGSWMTGAEAAETQNRGSWVTEPLRQPRDKRGSSWVTRAEAAETQEQRQLIDGTHVLTWIDYAVLRRSNDQRMPRRLGVRTQPVSRQPSVMCSVRGLFTHAAHMARRARSSFEL